MSLPGDSQTPELADFCWTVGQFNRAVSQALQQQFGPQRVRGEIANLTRAASGHWYFSLKDATAQVRCVMFRSRNAQLDFVPREGDEVEVTAAVGLYEPRGEFQLTVERLRRVGAGRLWEEFQRLRQRLAAEGLFDAARKRPLPFLPRRVGIVTSLQAAALRDVLTALRRRAPYLPVVVYPTPVQGAEAPPRIVAMLAQANARAEVDVLLLVRGGGSIEDLWAFNDEQVARAIVASRLPVIVGVGHESDFTIADFVADLRAPTPTAAAELVAPEREGLLREVASRLDALARAQARAMGERAQRLDFALRVLAAPRGPLRGLQARVADLGERLGRCLRQQLRYRSGELERRRRDLARARVDVPGMQLRLGECRRRLQEAWRRTQLQRGATLAHLERSLAHLNVQGVLDRGFAIVRASDGQVVTDAAVLVPGAPLQARFARGTARLLVDEAGGSA